MNIFEKLSDEYNDNCYSDGHFGYDTNKRFDAINEYLKTIQLNDEQIKNVCQLIDALSTGSWNKGESSGYNDAVRDQLNNGD